MADAQNTGYHWTSKAPFGLAALLFLAAAVVTAVVRRPWLVLIFAALAALCWWQSVRIGDWCLPNDPTFGAVFGATFYHHSLASCWRLVTQGG